MSRTHLRLCHKRPVLVVSVGMPKRAVALLLLFGPSPLRSQSLEHDRCHVESLAPADRIRSCLRALADDPGNTEARLAVGWAYYDAADVQRALREFEAA